MIQHKEHMKNKKVLVVGLGKSGRAAVQAMVKLGAQVFLQDSSPKEKMDPQLIAFLEGLQVTCYFGEIPTDLHRFDMLILSPGVPTELDFIQEAKDAGAEIIGELEIAYRIGCGNYVSITGTNGKTTTTTLVGEIFRKAKRKTYVVGNIGVAVISKALNAQEDDWLITETSSFQLETTTYFKPKISAILNLTPDHMDRHKTMENYGAAKAKVFQNQGADEYLVYNYDDLTCRTLVRDAKAKTVPFSRKEILDFGAFLKEDRLVICNEAGELIPFCYAKELHIPGGHNLENALAAVAMAYFSGIEPETITQALVEFQGVAHRIEYCGQVDGVRFVNDSKGTNPDASVKAIEAMETDIVLIAGGYDKNSAYDAWIQSFHGKVKHMVLLGQTAEKIKEAAEALGYDNCHIEKDMENCVQKAFQLAKSGDTVLLSPACASWGMYTNFEQRGDHFKDCVHRLGK